MFLHRYHNAGRLADDYRDLAPQQEKRVIGIRPQRARSKNLLNAASDRMALSEIKFARHLALPVVRLDRFLTCLAGILVSSANFCRSSFTRSSVSMSKPIRTWQQEMCTLAWKSVYSSRRLLIPFWDRAFWFYWLEPVMGLVYSIWINPDRPVMVSKSDCFINRCFIKRCLLW